jgi:hypothetical protein
VCNDIASADPEGGAAGDYRQREITMRTMLKAVIDTEVGNETVRNGTTAKLLEQMVHQLEAEAAYFAVEDGQRTCIVVFDLADSSRIPTVSEPFFLGAKARVTLNPCMNLDDVVRGLSELPPDLTSPGV